MDSVHSLKHLNIGQNLRVISRRIFNFKNMSRKRLDFFRKNVCKKSLTLPFISPFDRHYLSTPSLRFFSARFKNRRQDGLSRDVARTNSEIKVKESRKERKTSLNREPQSEERKEDNVSFFPQLDTEREGEKVRAR